MAQDSMQWMRTCFTSSKLLRNANSWQPLVDIYRTRTGWLIKFDLAGVRAEDVKLTFDGARLAISGVRRDWSVEEGCRHYCMEISYSYFERTIELPEPLERAQVTTEYRHGMLLVRIEKEAHP